MSEQKGAKPNESVESIPVHTGRDNIEERLSDIFREKLVPVNEAHEQINDSKDGSFAMSEMGMMLYTNGYNLRGISNKYPNGLVYRDGENIFGVGYFAKEGEQEGHLMIVSPKGEKRQEAVKDFIKRIREAGITESSIYVRFLDEADRDGFLQAGMEPIEADPWHPEAMEEDETYPNRIFKLDDLLELDEDGKIKQVKNLEGVEDRNHRKKNRDAYSRFENFLERNRFSFEIVPYTYSEDDTTNAKKIVEAYFESRRKAGGVVGSTPEDYLAIIKQSPHGENEKDYFAYMGGLRTSTGEFIPMSFFAGEKLLPNRVGLYGTITLRFQEDLDSVKQRTSIEDEIGFTAISQYAFLELFAKLKSKGIDVVDAGGSETKGLDDQKRQLGGKPSKTYWVVDRN